MYVQFYGLNCNFFHFLNCNLLLYNFKLFRLKKLETQIENLAGLQNNSELDDDQETNAELVITKIKKDREAKVNPIPRTRAELH